jgi:hypothetical protein
MTIDFSSVIMHTGRKCHNVFQILKESGKFPDFDRIQLRILYSGKTSL